MLAVQILRHGRDDEKFLVGIPFHIYTAKLGGLETVSAAALDIYPAIFGAALHV
jgi:hypothetical protein